MRRALILGGLLLTLGLAGCLGDTGGEDAGGTAAEATGVLSEKRFEILEPEVVWVASSQDGKRIHNVVYRPDTNESVPAFVNFSPYWGDSAEARGDNFARYMIEEYVPRGYAVVLSAIRGTGHSEGCFQIAGDLELQDTYDVVDHVANADWSNGNVAAGGKSYDSTTQNGMIAKVPHPALKGIFHVSGISDMYRYNYRMGVAYGHGTIFNTNYYGQTWHEYGLPLPLGGGSPAGAASPQDEGPDSLARAIDDAACTEFPEMQASGVGSGAHGMKDAYWQERAWTDAIGASDWNGSIFFVHGLQDWNVKPDHILPWLSNLPDQVPVKGWLHQNPENTGHVYPMRTDWNQTMLAWLDHELKGMDTGLDWGFQAEGTDGIWRASDTWPPALVDPTAFPAGEMGKAPAPDAAPWSGLVVANDGQAPLRYAGEPTLTLNATSDHSDPVLTATLWEVTEDGEATWMNEGVLRGVYRNGLEEPEPVEPGQPTQYTLTFYPQDDVLAPGSAWVLTVGGPTQQAQPTAAQTTGITYEMDGANLVLPMAPVDTAVEEQPEPTICFAC